MEHIKGLYWHCHHDVLLEYCYDYDERVAFIKKEKPKNERKTRLKLFKKVRGKLPDEISKAEAACGKAWAAFGKAEAAYGKAWAAFDKAWAALNKTIKKHSKEINELHDKECPNCPWDSNQQTIFPEET